MGNKILNVWKSKEGRLKYNNKNKGSKLEYYDIDDNKLIIRKGDYAVYSLWSHSYIYTYKNIAINVLAGYNSSHFKRLVSEKAPNDKKDSFASFIYARAMENKEKGLEFFKEAGIEITDNVANETINQERHKESIGDKKNECKTVKKDT